MGLVGSFGITLNYMQNFVFIFFYMQILGGGHCSYSIQFSGVFEIQMGFENNTNLG